MPADPITPGLSAAFSNTLPTATGVPAVVVAVCRATTQTSLSSGVLGTIDGVNLTGAGATRDSRMVLLTGQTAPAENGLYVTSNGGSSITVTGTFNGSGNYSVTGLTAGGLYYFLQNTAGNTISNGIDVLTESGYIRANSTTLTISGSPGGSQLNFLVNATLIRATLYDSPNEFPDDLLVRVTGGTGAPTWWRLASVVTTLGTSPVTFSQVTVGSLDTGTDDDPFDNTAPATATPANSTDFSNTAANASTDPLLDATIAMTGTAPENVTFADTAPFSNTPPTSVTLEGETAPVAGVTSPASPIIATQATTLVAGSNYLVQVGTRSSNQTITLPDPGSLGQRIEVADISGQAVTWPITVNCGTKQILDTGLTSYTINRANAVLALSYTGTAWKVL
jgi:hypothetical protein